MDRFGYIGQAGTGKTTELIKKVEEIIDLESWPESASILAITFMHGSRRRLESKLKTLQHKGIRVCCQTIDSFCLKLLQRYKSYLGLNHPIVITENPDELSEVDKKIYIGFQQVRNKANTLLNYSVVKGVLSFSYPILVVDEFQDCDGTLLEIIKKLTDCCSLYVAADDFQKLDNSAECPATDWLAHATNFKELKKIWRTNDGKILDSAKALRNNNPTNNGVEVKFAPRKDLAAYFILSNMNWYDRMGSGGKTIAIISPVGPQSDPFIRQTLERLHNPMERKKTKTKSGYKLYPYPFYNEGEKRITTQNILEKCIGWESLKVVTLEVINSWSFDEHLGFEIGVKRAKRLMKLRNTNQLSKEEFTGLISTGIHFANTYITKKGYSRVFLTVHGAKNREFDDVFVLWPKYTLQSEDLYLRKLMYNALTRAKRKVIVIVQGKLERQSECPINLISGYGKSLS